ncbi:Glutathione import ATP-binding protein GsiA [Acholeplasma oculi]|uniref:Oligopeptide ABC transport system, ATP-binding protein OppF n=1 Tax=Acholeplasma oculi TaxID=35623 RepID=A0A061A8M0_9MOLU|nr:ABC transporter ATP-binding protein [Acholeplasma oculi]CDR30220.1 Oligopeptide ABC transport system, ATP-binding protein OppF [Acholeplasma oculi]SKC43835.1 peptide/nickel transport system ATP-binding protein [Acholeplasma oculi]SUT88602.1 Glutathione import ATP-binding protein GsiA [Acholeplasma oculi]
MEELMRLDDINMIFTKKIGFMSKNKTFQALKNVNLTINKGEIIAVVGESGSGKTTIGRIITGLIKPTSGELYYEGKKFTGMINKKVHNSNIQFIQQDSYAALNPVKTIYQSLYAPIKTYNKRMTKAEIDEKIVDLMGLIGLIPVDRFLDKFPHQLSGGQRQRVLMARAISLNPKIIVADEPVSMIDVSLRLSILNLMNTLNKKMGVTFIYITHDLATARFIAQEGRIVVMYKGEVVETGNIESILKNPQHNYTKALIRAVPIPDPTLNTFDDIEIEGESY